MSVGSFGILGAAAGSSLSQSQGTELQRTQQETSQQARQLQAGQKAEEAAGVGQTEQDEGAGDRDADGRRLWELPPHPSSSTTDTSATRAPAEPPVANDPTGVRGTRLDLRG